MIDRTKYVPLLTTKAVAGKMHCYNLLGLPRSGKTSLLLNEVASMLTCKQYFPIYIDGKNLTQSEIEDTIKGARSAMETRCFDRSIESKRTIHNALQFTHVSGEPVRESHGDGLDRLVRLLFPLVRSADGYIAILIDNAEYASKLSQFLIEVAMVSSRVIVVAASTGILDVPDSPNIHMVSSDIPSLNRAELCLLGQSYDVDEEVVIKLINDLPTAYWVMKAITIQKITNDAAETVNIIRSCITSEYKNVASYRLSDFDIKVLELIHDGEKSPYSQEARTILNSVCPQSVQTSSIQNAIGKLFSIGMLSSSKVKNAKVNDVGFLRYLGEQK